MPRLRLQPAAPAAICFPPWQSLIGCRQLGVCAGWGPDRLERQLVPGRYPLFTVRAGGLQGRGLRKLKQLIQLLWSAWPVAA